MRLLMKVSLLLFLMIFHSRYAFAEEAIGYRLYYDGKQVGSGANWNIRQSIANFRLMTATYPQIKVKATFNGVDLFYLKRVEVLPVFFVAKGEDKPDVKLMKKINKHLLITQKRYFEMLSKRDTFSISERQALIYESKFTIKALQR